MTKPSSASIKRKSGCNLIYVLSVSPARTKPFMTDQSDHLSKSKVLGCIDMIQEIRTSESLNVFRVTERSQGFYSDKELEAAFLLLGCLSSNVSDDQIVDAYTTATSDTSLTDRKKAFRDALKLIAKDRNSDVMRAILVSEEEVESKMDLAAAYRTLEVSDDIDEDILNMTFNIRVSGILSTPSKLSMTTNVLAIAQLEDATTSAQKTTMKEAAGLIADARGFSRTRRLIDTGDAGDAGEIICVFSLRIGPY